MRCRQQITQSPVVSGKEFGFFSEYDEIPVEGLSKGMANSNLHFEKHPPGSWPENRLQGDNTGSKETNWNTVAVFQMRDDSGVGPGGGVTVVRFRLYVDGIPDRIAKE